MSIGRGFSKSMSRVLKAWDAQTGKALTYWVTCWDKEGHQNLFTTSFMVCRITGCPELSVNSLHELFSHNFRNKYFSRGSFWWCGFLWLCYQDVLHDLPSNWSYNTGLRKDGFISVPLVDFHITWIELLLSLENHQQIIKKKPKLYCIPVTLTVFELIPTSN